MARRCPKFEPGSAGAEGLGSLKMHHFRGEPLQLNLKGWAMQSPPRGVHPGLKFSGYPTQPEPIFESRAVYNEAA